VLLLGFLLSVLLNPASLAFYSLERADLLAWLNLVQLGINFAGNLVLIPSLGGFGAALSSLAVRVFGSVYILWFLRRFLFSREGSSP
jgi:O-antigen/teichoic acid export membrane protein